MPNWCNNSICISGSPESVKSFADEIQELYNLQQSPEYKANDEMVKPEYCKDIDGGYFNLDCGDIDDFNFPDDWFNYTTKWSPNLEVLKRMADKHGIKILCEYEELGNLIYGKWRYNAETGEEFEVCLEAEDFDKYGEDDETGIYYFRNDGYETENDILEILLDEKEDAILADLQFEV